MTVQSKMIADRITAIHRNIFHVISLHIKEKTGLTP